MKRLAWMAVLAAGLLGSTAAQAANETSGWKLIEGKWGSGGSQAVWKMAAWPGKDEVVASASGLWSSKDGGETWQKLGEGGNTPNGAGKAVQFVFDPRDLNVMWTSGMYQWGVWKTIDGGRTFTQVSTQMHVDGFAVDFTDPARKVQLLGLHEQEHSLHKSIDGGESWVKIGDKIPEGSEFSTDPIILDSSTYIINSCGWSKPGEKWGTYRTTDGGESWTKTSDEGASGNPLVTSKGDIFWATQWAFELIKSSDQGKTWQRVKSSARGSVAEIIYSKLINVPAVASIDGGTVAIRNDKNRIIGYRKLPSRVEKTVQSVLKEVNCLVALGGAKKAQLYVSKDDGKTWTPFGDALPFAARGFTYDAVRKSFFACPERGTGVARWDITGDLDAALSQASSDVTVWDGEGFADGNGWVSPTSKNAIKMTTAEHYNGKQSLEFHAEGAASVSAGWNWANWQSPAMTDLTGFESLSFYVKVTGDKPTQVEMNLTSGPDKAGASSDDVDIAKYAPEYMDGQWHEVKVPLKALSGDSKFNLKAAYEIRFITNQAKESSFSMFVDAVKFLKAPQK